MPRFDWQAVAAGAIVVGATVYLLRAIVRTIKTKRQSTSCGGCGTCDASKTPAAATPRDFVAVENLRRPT